MSGEPNKRGALQPESPTELEVPGKATPPVESSSGEFYSEEHHRQSLVNAREKALPLVECPEQSVSACKSV